MKKIEFVIHIALWALFAGHILTFEVRASQTRETPSFAKTFSAFEKLCKNSLGTRDEWQRVITSFLAIYKAKKDSSASRSLFFAGRASLALYRRSEKIEDLDNAIKYLNNFNWVSRKSHDMAIGMGELKKAQNLKLRISKASQERTDGLLSEKSTVPAGASVNPMTSAGQAYSSESPKNIFVSKTSRAANGSSHSSGSRPTLNRPGNPYFSALNRPAVSSQARLKSASIPPVTMTDGLPAKRVVEKKSKDFVVVIDPGHGGKDPGAVSQDGRFREKDLTLEMAKRLKDRLQGQVPGIKVMLTRNDDSFMTLPERTSFANSLNADLFLSIHGNGAGDSRVKGIETYYLSKSSSRGAMRVAARENGISPARMSDLEATLVDLMVTSKKSESETLANTVHGSLMSSLLQRDPSARDRGVKRAPFYVLLGAKMPAILVECAFISNGRDRDRLSSNNHLDLIADGIVDGAAKYLRSLGDKS